MLPISTIIVGIFATALTQIFKKVESVPLDENNAKAVRITVAVISFVGVLFVRWQAGSLMDQGFINDTAGMLGQALMAYLIAHTSYKAILQTPAPTPTMASVVITPAAEQGI